MRIALRRLWRTLFPLPVRPAPKDPGPVDAIVRLLKNAQLADVRAPGSEAGPPRG